MATLMEGPQSQALNLCLILALKVRILVTGSDTMSDSKLTPKTCTCVRACVCVLRSEDFDTVRAAAGWFLDIQAFN